MLPTQKNKLTLSILGRLRQGGPPPAGNMKPFNPLDGVSPESPTEEEDDLGRQPTESDGVDVADDSESDLLQPQFPRKRKKGPTLK